MDINQQKLEQDLITEKEIALDNKVNNEVENKSEKDLLEKEIENKSMDDKTCECGENCDCKKSCECGKDCDCGDDCVCGEDCTCKHDRIDKDLLDKEEREFKEGGKSEENDFDREGALENQVVTEITEDANYPETESEIIPETNEEEIIKAESHIIPEKDSYPFAQSDEYDTSDVFPYAEENILTEEADVVSNNLEDIDVETDEYKINKENIEEIERSHPEDN